MATPTGDLPLQALANTDMLALHAESASNAPRTHAASQ